jgi:hypothetical protein
MLEGFKVIKTEQNGSHHFLCAEPFKRTVSIFTEPIKNGEKHLKLVKSNIFQNKNVLHLFMPVAVHFCNS